MKSPAFLLVSVFLISPLAPAAPEMPLQVVLPETPSKEMPKIDVKVPMRVLKLPPVRRVESEWLPAGNFTVRRIEGLIDLFGGAENLGVAMAPEKIELVRLKGKVPYPWKPDDFLEVQTAPLSDDDGVALRAILTSDATYNWEGEDSECIPPYECRVKFRQKTKVICVDLCFDCCMMRVVRDGREVADKNMDFGLSASSEIVSRYFPELGESGANKPPLRTPVSGTPAADAPVAPPSGAAGR